MISEKQKWPTDKNKYDESYARIFGEKCSYCNGKGYYIDNDIETPCLYCNGEGRIYKKVKEK